jgi:hypothetical protein
VIGRKINYSHTTVALALKTARCPTWPVLQAIVTYLDGDLEEFRSYWIAARDAEDPLPDLRLPDGQGQAPAQLTDDGEAPALPDGQSPGITDQRVVLRWKNQLETFEFFDKGLALQWIKARAWGGEGK